MKDWLKFDALRQRWIYLVVLAALSVFLCAVALNLDAAQAISIYNRFAYWTIGLSFAIWGYFLYQLFLEKWGESKERREWKALWPNRNVGILIILVLLTFAYMVRTHPPGFRTIMDEHLIAATAKRMHENRTADVPHRYLRIDGKPVALFTSLDKRPHAYAFLVAAVHDVFGYRIDNPFLVNRFMLLIVLGCLAGWAYQVAGVGGAAAALGLLAMMPLLANSAAGGGLQPSFIAFILIQLMLMAAVLRSPTTPRIGALCLTTILLAQTRYEAILFVIPCGIVVVEAVIRFDWRIPWPVWLCPLLLLPYLLRHRVMETRNDSYQMGDIPGAEAPFSLDFVPENLSRFIFWGFEINYHTPNMPFVSLAGVLALVVLLVVTVRKWSNLRQNMLLRATAYTWGGLALLWGMLLAYGWPIDSEVTRRLMLPCFLIPIMAIVIVVFRWNRGPVLRKFFWVTWGLAFLGITMPTMALGYYYRNQASRLEFEIAAKFLEDIDDRYAIILAENRGFFYLYDQPTAGSEMVASRMQQTANFLAMPNRPRLLFFAREVWNPVTQSFDYGSRVGLDKDLIELTTLKVVPYTDMRRVVLYEVTAVHHHVPEVIPPMGVEEYLESVARNLP